MLEPLWKTVEYFLTKLKAHLYYGPEIVWVRTLEKVELKFTPQKLQMKVATSFICNNLKLETTQISFFGFRRLNNNPQRYEILIPGPHTYYFIWKRFLV